MKQEQRKSACGMSAHIEEGAGNGKRGAAAIDRDGGTNSAAAGLRDQSAQDFRGRPFRPQILTPTIAGRNKAAPDGAAEGGAMETILIVVVIMLLLGGGGWYGRGRWY